MGDALTEFLASGTQGVAQIDADLLKLAGQRAASSFLTGEAGDTLTNLVAKEAAAVPGIQNEHIKRMCEFTNLIVHDALFQKQASVKDGSVVYVTFSPSDPVDVIKQLNDGTKVAHVTLVGEQDYALPPPRLFGATDDGFLSDLFLTKEAELQGDGGAVFSYPIVEKGTTIEAPMNLLGETTGKIPDPAAVAIAAQEKKYPSDKLVFTVDDAPHEFKVPAGKMNAQDPKLQKISEASVSYPRANPHADLFALRTEVEDNLRSVQAQAEGMEVQADDAWDEFYGHVKQAMLDRGSFSEVSDVCFEVCQGNTQFHEATVQTVAHKLMTEKVASARKLDADLEKRASVGTVNPENPLVKSYAGFCVLLGQQTKLASIAGELTARLKDIDDYVRGLVPDNAAFGYSQ